MLKAVSCLRAVRYNQLAVLLYGGSLKRAYIAADPLITNDFLRQKRDPNDRRKRALLLTAQGARVIGVAVRTARIEAREFAETLEDNDFYVRAVTAGVPKEDILTRQETLEATRADKRYARMSWGIKNERGIHYVYVRHNWVPKRLILDSLIYCGNKAASHTLVCRTDKGLRFNLKWFMRQSADIPLNIITLDEVPSYVFWLNAEFSDTAQKVMEALTPGGRLGYTDSDCTVALAWQHPTKGNMLLADLRVGDLHTLRGLKDHDFSAQPVTAFVTQENQARRWAHWLGWPENLWFIACNGGPGCTLYRVSGSDITVHKTVSLEEAAAG